MTACATCGGPGVRSGRFYCSRSCYIQGQRGPRLRPLAVRWAENVSKTAACWRWTGKVDIYGYGYLSRGWPLRGNIGAHRAAWELLRGPIPEGLTIDHLCRVRLCVNPDHLEPVTNVENVMRGEGFAARAARQTHCKWGHPFDERNTYHYPKGGRGCRACNRESQRRFKARRKAA